MIRDLAYLTTVLTLLVGVVLWMAPPPIPVVSAEEWPGDYCVKRCLTDVEKRKEWHLSFDVMRKIRRQNMEPVYFVPVGEFTTAFSCLTIRSIDDEEFEITKLGDYGHDGNPWQIDCTFEGRLLPDQSRRGWCHRAIQSGDHCTQPDVGWDAKLYFIQIGEGFDVYFSEVHPGKKEFNNPFDDPREVLYYTYEHHLPGSCALVESLTRAQRWDMNNREKWWEYWAHRFGDR